MNCTGITVQNGDVGKIYYEILLFYTNNSNIRDTHVPIRLVSSSHNTIAHNAGTVQLENSSSNTITENTIKYANRMIYLTGSSGNITIASAQTYSSVIQWGIMGSANGEFKYPMSVAVDGEGYVYVAEYQNSLVQKFTSDGLFVTKWGIYGTGEGQFNGTMGIAFDSEENVYVTDTNNKVQKFVFESSEVNNTIPVAIIIGVSASIFGLSFFWWKKFKKPRKNVKPPSNPTQTVVLAPKSLNYVFISHVEEDTNVALDISEALEKAGYTTWCYECNSVPGPSYLLQTKQAVEQSKAVIVVISPNSLSSRQITAEVVRAHESGKPFIPVLLGISYVEFQQRQPEWHVAIGSATSISIPKQGLSVILARLIRGLKRLGVKKSVISKNDALKL